MQTASTHTNELEDLTPQEASILLEHCHTQIDVLTAERDKLRQRVLALEERSDTFEAIASAEEDRAEAALKANAVVKAVLDNESIDVAEIGVLARARATLDLPLVLDSFPEHLWAALAQLDPDRPRLGKLALSRLRPGSVLLLETYGICTFGDADAQEVRTVTLTERTWKVAELARKRQSDELTNSPTPDLGDIERDLDELDSALAEHFETADNSTKQ